MTAASASLADSPPPPPDFATIRDMVLARADDDATAILYEDERWSYREYVAHCCAVAHFLLDRQTDGRTPQNESAQSESSQNETSTDPPFHIGVLLDNGPHFSIILGAAALCGATVVGINPTRRGRELVRDISHTQCQLIITEAAYLDLLDPVAAELPDLPLFNVDSPDWSAIVDSHRRDFGPTAPDVTIDPLAPYLLIFTSGTTGDPKAAICSQQRIARIACVIAQTQQLTAADVCYQCMPMFHSNALLAGWSPCLAVGAAAAFRRRFSASSWLADIRKHGATYFNYVGKPLTYILATPAQPDDADNPLRRVFGNEGAPHDLDRFAARFDVSVQDSYGSTEGGFGISRTPDTPPGALGRADEQTKVYHPETAEECPPARFAPDGSLTNPDEAIGELVHLRAATDFEGYWNNAEADDERIHGGIYWSGDLGYRDAAGFFYFAGRNYDWLRVDGENFAAAPLEAILARHPDVLLAAVYAVPNSDVGDDVMAALIHAPGATFDPQRFADFLAAQTDLGTKWLPRYVRWAADLPKTETMKILKRVLRQQRWECDDEVWVRDEQGEVVGYRRLTEANVAGIREEFVRRERVHLL